MKYKGFEIKTRYLAGADFDFNQYGIMVSRKPKPEDRDNYEVIDAMTGKNINVLGCKSIKETKSEIDGFLKSIGIVSNTKKEWDKFHQSENHK
jgi:hypothetical protein